MKKENIWVIIPAYNEGRNLAEVIEKTKGYVKNIVVVDDGSRDNTYNKAKEKGVTVLRHIVNLGKGAALKTGCDYAVMKGAGKLIVMDADGQHDPAEIPNFLKTLEKNEVVFGFRKLDKNMPLLLKYGNWFISSSIRLLYKISLRDTQCGYRAFTAEAYKKIRWKVSDYSMESEMIANVGRSHLKYREIPIRTIYSDRYKGTTIIDGFKIVFNMILWKLRR
jgi:glycosyltransferase involved in cell wall biosynthesis